MKELTSASCHITYTKEGLQFSSTDTALFPTVLGQSGFAFPTYKVVITAGSVTTVNQEGSTDMEIHSTTKAPVSGSLSSTASKGAMITTSSRPEETVQIDTSSVIESSTTMMITDDVTSINTSPIITSSLSMSSSIKRRLPVRGTFLVSVMIGILL